MKPVFQTKFLAPGGDCVKACVASILELELDDVPDIPWYAERWWDHLDRFLRGRGLVLVRERGRCPVKNVYHIRNLVINDHGRFYAHAVVAVNDEVVHDPHPDTPSKHLKPYDEYFIAFGKLKVYEGKS